MRFSKVGDTLEKGQILCVLESMKMVLTLVRRSRINSSATGANFGFGALIGLMRAIVVSVHEQLLW